MRDNFQKAVKTMSEYIRKFSGSAASFSEQSISDLKLATTAFSHANIKIEIAIIQPKGKKSPDVLFSAGVCPLPKENLLPLFRQLLVWNNFQTGPAHFSISSSQNAVFVVSRRPIADFEFSEFTDIISTISSVTLNAIVTLRKQFGA